MFRSVAEFEKTGEPTPAEVALIAACGVGENCWLGDGSLPPEGVVDPERSIRASLIRLLAMGGTPDCELHAAGVWLMGARITGELDLRFATTRGRLALHACRFDAEPRLDQARLDELSLQDSHLPGLFAQGARINGNLFLNRITSTATIYVNSARITGSLACEGASLDGGTGMALNLQGAKVGGDVFLRAMKQDGRMRRFTAKGTVDLAGAEIAGVLDCSGASLDGGAGLALNAQGAKVGDGFFFRHVESVKGLVDLNTAHFSDLVDDAASWGKCEGGWNLSGLTYDRIAGDGPKTFAGRKEWLEKGALVGKEFRPQPYTQVARVFAATGDMGEARKVLYARDRELFAAADRRDQEQYDAAIKATDQTGKGDAGRIWLRQRGRRMWEVLSRVVVGYGHHPERAFYCSLAAVLVGLVWFRLAWELGVMVPNSDVIMTSAHWLLAMKTDAIATTHEWAKMPPATHYETFYALIYALDVYIPLVSLGQESTWAVTTVTWAGWATRVLVVAFQAAGWIVTSLGIAAITGFVQRGSPE